MKKRNTVSSLVFFYVVLNLLSIGCASNRSTSSADELDAAIREASNYLNENIPKGNKLAFLNFRSEYQTLSEYVIDELISNTINDRLFTVVDRANLALIQQEIDFQMSGEISDETAVSIGQMLGAQTIVSGTVSQMGDLFRLRVRALDVQTAQILGQFNRNIPNNTTIALLTENPAITSGTAVPRTNTPNNQSKQAQAAKYKIGDTGPAGGIVFYDKGHSIGGWRYLEAAPPETEKSASMTSNNNNAVVGSRKIGEGKENTKKFMDVFQKNGGGINTAPWICSELIVNGFDDWYLPSLDELQYMYNNLYSQGLGEFKNSLYWSSYVNGWWNIFCIDFSDGSEKMPILLFSPKHQARAIRQF
jgi:TolB-like protein